MKSRALFPAAALVAAIAPLAACVSQSPTLAAKEGTQLEPPCGEITGTRIRTDREECAPVGLPLKSFSAEELQSTGELDMAEALRQLDPAFR